MNQDPNNLNQNNSFNQNVNADQMNMQQPTPQPMNSFESGNIGSQSFDNKPPKKINIGLIIGTVVVVAVIGIGIVVGGKLLSNNENSNNSENNVSENSTNDNPNKNNNDSDKNIPNQTALEYFDVSKFDKNKFNGVVYNSEGQYNITDLLAEKSNNTGSYRSITVALDGGLRYAFANDYSNWRTMYSESHKQSSDDYVNALLETLGHPSTYCEKYFDDENGKTGHFYLYYNYGNYVIFVLGYDYRGNEKYNFNYIGISQISISSSDDFEFNLTDDLTCYGEFANN